MIEKIKLISQSALRIQSNKIIYFDSFKLTSEFQNDADIIFITHPHYDHFSKEDILKIKKETTKIVVPNELYEEAIYLGFKDVVTVEPNKNYTLEDISFSTVPAYNLNKDFHKKEFNWVGYILDLNNQKLYIAGDTDNVPEIRNIKCDIAFVPIGGTYTMTYKEAVELIKEINPGIAIPIHYKTIVGSVDDAYNFKKELDGIVDVKILMK